MQKTSIAQVRAVAVAIKNLISNIARGRFEKALGDLVADLTGLMLAFSAAAYGAAIFGLEPDLVVEAGRKAAHEDKFTALKVTVAAAQMVLSPTPAGVASMLAANRLFAAHLVADAAVSKGWIRDAQRATARAVTSTVVDYVAAVVSGFSQALSFGDMISRHTGAPSAQVERALAKVGKAITSFRFDKLGDAVSDLVKLPSAEKIGEPRFKQAFKSFDMRLRETTPAQALALLEARSRPDFAEGAVLALDEPDRARVLERLAPPRLRTTSAAATTRPSSRRAVPVGPLLAGAVVGAVVGAGATYLLTRRRHG